MSKKKFKQKDFNIVSDESMLSPHQMIDGDIILKSNGTLFFIDTIESEFINDEVAEQYGEFDEVKPEHTVKTFYGGKSDADCFNAITEIPHTARFHVWRMIGK